LVRFGFGFISKKLKKPNRTPTEKNQKKTKPNQAKTGKNRAKNEKTEPKPRKPSRTGKT
jgi:hypothetical protein